VAHCTRAYALFRQRGDTAGAVRCAVWLAITYKANFANFAASNGWVGRAERLLQGVEPGSLHGWTWIARAYRLGDLDTAAELTERALAVARDARDVDLELVALAQLGLIGVGQGDTVAGFALIDEAMAAALAGERGSLDTVVYAACDMLHACELASDLERAEQWCRVADDFVATYGCPFLYAECRLFYGSVLVAKGRWADAEQELDAGLRITEGTCPALHDRALTRLAILRVRQGRLEEAERLLAGLSARAEADAEVTLSVSALLLARGDPAAACRVLEDRAHHLTGHRSQLAAALEQLVDGYLADGDLAAAASTADRLAEVVGSAADNRLRALVDLAGGRLSMARGDSMAAVLSFEAAVATWTGQDLPFEAARARFELGRALATTRPDAAVDQGRLALTAFEELGARLEADRTAAFLRSLGVTARTGAKGVGTLTHREQEVLALLGHGLSNPEIALRLHVTRKTAAHHVSSVLSKLNLRNRAEAAFAASGPPGSATSPASSRGTA
jgi:ATP/maltotriose-dependent transcriptional regulator MalT